MTYNPNSQLKDFQVATVDYVFQRFTDEVNQCSRFLVADEVGLGKTLVARGIIKKFYEHFRLVGKHNFNVIYICSNRSIASQNINRLNIEKQKGIAATQISRLNELAVTQINDKEHSFLQIMALSPDTSFNISKGGGISKERAILYLILSKHPDFCLFKVKLKKILQLDVGDCNWNNVIIDVKSKIREDISKEFNAALEKSNAIYSQLLEVCDARYTGNDLTIYRRVIGGMRTILASVCVKYLNPDLIIMDEFQRFKYLLDSDKDSDLTLITENLFNDDKIKMLLLSATPYKMFALQSEEEQGESHFDEFKFIVKFLLNDDLKYELFKHAWEDYSRSLLHLEQRNWILIKGEKAKVEALLRSIIARTERITVSDDKNTLLRPSPLTTLSIKPEDIKCFISADTVAMKLKDVNSPIEFCKSAPFPFSFMDGYQLQKTAQEEVRKGNREVKNALQENLDSFLPIEKMSNYQAIAESSSKLSYLLEDSLYNGGANLLWIPPALPYYQFDGAYLGKDHFSKTLVFSSWIMVPKMIAALSTYEAERSSFGETKNYSYFETNTHPKDKLKFGRKDNTLTSLAQYSLLYPCMTLSEIWTEYSNYPCLPDLFIAIETKIKSLLKQLSIPAVFTDPTKKEDDRWALVYMILLDRKFKKEKLTYLKSSENKIDWGWFNKDEENSIANLYYEAVFDKLLFANQARFLSASELRYLGKQEDPIFAVLHTLKIGRPPVGIEKQLAYLTIASPAICSYRLLSASISKNKNFDHISFFGAFRIADSFRKFFNKPENTIIIEKYAKFDSYWKNVLGYAAEGNFQSMLDEYASAMIDHNGLWDYQVDDKLNKLIEILSQSIGLRTVTIAAHTYESFAKESKPKHFRCHYGVALNHSLVNEKDYIRSDSVRDAFNSPFRPFILATTSIGQEGLDFHLYCRKILHWNLPANPVDFEQREGRINRFKNHAIRQNLAEKYRNNLENENSATVWDQLYQLAIEFEKGNKSDLVPFWHVEPQNIFIERQVPTIPYSKEVKKLKNLLKTISVYRIALGQPRQEDLVNHLIENYSDIEIEKIQDELLMNLSPYRNYIK